jgi:hypothetical protein
MLSSYDPHEVLRSVDTHTLGVMGFMTICLVSTFIYLVSAFRTSTIHRAYPAPLAAVGFFAIHDASFVAHWNDWFTVYDHWWLKAWAIALIFTAGIECALCYKVFQYGREELMPRLTQTQFGVAIVLALVAVGVVWAVIKGILDDPLFLIAFAVTAWMPPVWSTILLCGRGSMRGQTMLMNWCLVTNPIGMFGAWFFLDPYFRSPVFLAFGAVTVGWALFNVWVMSKYPVYEPSPSSDAAPVPV